MSGSGLRELIANLRRRQVFKAAAVYGAVGYLLVQIADVFVPALLLPEWVLPAVAYTVVLGFPLVLVLAWMFDVTPDGLEREADAPPTGKAPRPAGFAQWLVLGAALVGTGLVAKVVVDLIRSESGGEEPAPRVATLDASKLAVLPFDNLAGPDDAAFAEGVHDDILTRLQRVRTLKVMTRQSVLEFSDTELGTDEIARELGARYLLTGTVQRAADRLRINVQLADAETEESPWNRQFDETWSVETLFDVQSRIAEEVAGALQVTLTQAERDAIARNATESIEAYDLMLRAEKAYNSGYGQELSFEAVDLARRAVEVDPGFSLGWAMLAMAHAMLHHQGFDRTPERLALARAAADSALALDPDLPEAHAALGHYHYWGRRDYEAALEQFGIAERVAPSARWVLSGIAAVRRRQGRMEEALDYFERSRDLQPRAATAVAAVAETLFLLRRFAEAAEEHETALEIEGIDGSFLTYQGLILFCRDGDTRAARETMRQARRRGLTGEGMTLTELRLALFDRDPEAALEVVAAAEPVIGDLQYRYYPRELARGWALRLAGDSASAAAAFESAAAELETARAERPEDERIAGALGLAYAGLERRDEAIAAATRSTELMPIEVDVWRGGVHLEELARVHAEFGDADAAIPLLERLLDTPSELSRPILRADPAFDLIRGDPRFAGLLED